MKAKISAVLLSISMMLTSAVIPAAAQEFEEPSEVTDIQKQKTRLLKNGNSAGNQDDITFEAYPDIKDTLNTTILTDCEKMYRLYNPNSGEHFYTSSPKEWLFLINQGWENEEVGWTAPAASNSPVYRLYNPNVGDHHYTMSTKEKDVLVQAGWKDEGIGWYSSDSKDVPMYRQYNPNAVTGTHNYTASRNENDALVRYGWRAEDIGWYGLSGFDWSGWYQEVGGGVSSLSECSLEVKKTGLVTGFSYQTTNMYLSESYWEFFVDELEGHLKDFKLVAPGHYEATVIGAFMVPMEISDYLPNFQYILDAGFRIQSKTWPTVMWEDQTVHFYQAGTRVSDLDDVTKRHLSKDDNYSVEKGVITKGLMSIPVNGRLFYQNPPVSMVID